MSLTESSKGRCMLSKATLELSAEVHECGPHTRHVGPLIYKLHCMLFLGPGHLPIKFVNNLAIRLAERLLKTTRSFHYVELAVSLVHVGLFLLVSKVSETLQPVNFPHESIAAFFRVSRV